MIAEDQLIGARFDKCSIERLIGRGGYGLTFLAYDDELREQRVIKLSLAWGEDDASRRRHEKSFIEEGLIISRLKHPQIVTLRAQGAKDGRRYMILDYIHGHSLKALLDTVERRRQELGCAWGDLLDPAAATALVLSTLHPLAYAHRANVHLPDREIFGVAHRDISPGNLILGLKGNEKGNVILIDFGTAKTELNDDFTANQNLVGTVPYMGKARLQRAASPEQAAEYQAYWRSFRETQHDVHALGVLYHQLLTGKLPFPGESTPQIIVKVLDPDLYPALHAAVEREFPAAGGILRKSLVYHDFSRPYHEQPYQFPDASAMLPEVEQAFMALSRGRSARDVLIELGDRLSRPETLAPRLPLSPPAPWPEAPASTVTVASPMVPYLVAPARRPSGAKYAAVLALAVAAALGTAWMLRPRPAVPAPSGRPDAPAPQSANAPSRGENAPPAGNPALPLSDLEKLEPAEPQPARPAQLTPPPRPPAASAAKAPATPAPEAGPPPTREVSQPSESPPLNKEAFAQLQILVREDHPSAFERISDGLKRHPESPDLLLLKSQLVLRRNPTSAETRRDLASLQGAQPAFMHPRLFHENALYLLWQADAALYEARKDPASRVNLLKSANAYVSAFQPNPDYARKVRQVLERTPGIREKAMD